jgi:hypothetical protein
MKVTTERVAQALIDGFETIYVPEAVERKKQELLDLLQEIAMCTQHDSGMHDEGITSLEAARREEQWAFSSGGICAAIMGDVEDILWQQDELRKRQAREIANNMGAGI